MALKNIDTYIERHGLVETTDATVNKPIYRKPGFDGIVSLSAMEENFSRFLRRKRDAQRLNRQQVGTMVGIHHEIYARHERAAARLTMTRLLHLAELLDFSPIEAIHTITPQFFGSDRKEADMKFDLAMRISGLSAEAAEALLRVAEQLPTRGSNEAQMTKHGGSGA